MQETIGGESDGETISFAIPKDHICQNDSTFDGCDIAFPIFIHEEGSFFFNTGHYFIGTTLLFGERGKSLFIQMKKDNHDHLSLEAYSPCDSDQTYKGWIECIREAIESRRNCSFPWNDTNETR